MAFDAAANTAWLGAEVTIAGVSTPLPARLIKLLEVAFGDDLYTEGDVPDATDVLVDEDIKARLLVWNAVIDDVCKAQAAIVLSSEKLITCTGHQPPREPSSVPSLRTDWRQPATPFDSIAEGVIDITSAYCLSHRRLPEDVLAISWRRSSR
jgi:hypothetical protein